MSVDFRTKTTTLDTRLLEVIATALSEARSPARHVTAMTLMAHQALVMTAMSTLLASLVFDDEPPTTKTERPR